jgi:hypothetical protein
MKIFYSWQSDTPDKVGKSFIRNAIDEAVASIAEEMDLEEAERPTVDQDTQGVMGSPAIAETIFEKIKNSEVIIVDVTLIGETNSGKKLINSNVAYELGFAHGCHDDSVLFPIMNTYYGSPDDLPFDLKHRRWPVRFELNPESPKAKRKEIKDKLVKEMSNILKLYLGNRKPKEKYTPTPNTFNEASYWNEDEYIIQRIADEDRGNDLKLTFTKEQALVYLRLWPDRPLTDLSGKELADYKISQIQPLLGRTGGYSNCRNKYGTITYGGENAGRLMATTQVFKNKEIWGVEAFILRPREEKGLLFVPTQVFEQGMIKSLNVYTETAWERLGYTDIIHVKAGLINVEGYKLAMPTNYSDNFWGPIFEDINVEFTVNKHDKDTIKIGLLKLFNSVFDSAGTERPINLYDFPNIN